MLEGDREVTDKARTWLPENDWSSIAVLLKEHEDAVLGIASGRYDWIARMVRAAVMHPGLGQISLTDRLDRIAVHPLWGLLLLLAMFILVFWLTFTVAVPIQHWLDVNVVEQFQGWLAVTLANAPPWLGDLLVHGVLGGAGIVVTFVPILIVFFSALAFLEDTGYLVRAAYVMDRFVWNNTWAFLRKAGTIILLASIVIWALSSFPGPDVEQSYLARFGQSLTPIGQLMGMDWRMIVALISSFVAKENAITTLGILYGTGEEGRGFAEMMAAVVSPASALSFLAVAMLFIPCVATVAVMHQETRSWRWTLFGVLLLLLIALSAGVIVYQGSKWLGIGV